MRLINYRKETSERSDTLNWVKEVLEKDTPYFYASIEGCNQNTENVVTHLIERARVDAVEGRTQKSDVLQQITALEGADNLQRKINFAALFGLPLSYVLYCDEKEHVFLFYIHHIEKLEFVKHYTTYKSFADWIAEIKGWTSSKPFRERQDLPYFDKQLRRHKTPWPTNIDCFFTDKQNRPIGIIEYQNAKKTSVLKHSNNDHFQCKLSYTSGTYTKYSDDIRRWTSQEILRVQSGLRLFIITWSQTEDDVQIKELDLVAIPYFPTTKGKPDWKQMSAYKGDLNKYVHSNRQEKEENNIAQIYKTYYLNKENNKMTYAVNEPVLSYADKTFPSLYYSFQQKIEGNRRAVADVFKKLIDV